MTALPVLVGALAFLISFALTVLMERFARKGLVDVETDQSSHSGARPRGGG